MKVLIVSMDSVGEGLPWALRAAKAGHSVKLWIAPDADKLTGTGFKGVERIDNWLAHAKWSDILIPTGNHCFMNKFDMLRKSGVRVFGPSVKSAELEIKRAEGMKIFEDHDIEVPEWEQFATLDKVEAHVRKTGDRFVFKTLGDADDKSTSYVAKSPADMIARIQRWKKLGSVEGPFMLQEFIEGYEFAVSRWMGTDGFIGKYNENAEFKKLLSGNVGPNCGEAGTVLKYVDTSKLGDYVLGPLEEDLVKMGHIGDVDVNCIVAKEGGQAYPLEWTCRAGWPSTNILLASHKGDPVQWAYDACEGEDSLEVSPQVFCGIVLSQPDYPFSKFTKAEVTDIPIYGVTPQNGKYIHPQAVKISKMPDMQGDEIVDRDIWTTTGDYLAVVTGSGKTVKKACERAYETVKEVHVPNICYRDDVGEKLKDEIPALHKFGYATEFSYE